MMLISLILIFVNLYIKSTYLVCIDENIACRKPAFQSSTYGDSLKAFANLSVDGYFISTFFSGSNLHCTHTLENLTDAWLKIDMENEFIIDYVIILGRNGDSFYKVVERLDFFIIGLSNKDLTNVRSENELCGQWSGKAISGANMTIVCSYNRMPSRYIIVHLPKWSTNNVLTVCELQAFGRSYNENYECPIGLYNKPYCDKVCHCENDLPCDQQSGKCFNRCLSDWRGEACDQYVYEWKNTLYSNCVLDSPNITSFNIRFSNMTISICIDNCFNQGYIFAALYNGNECHCAHEYYNESQIDQNMCNANCSGNSLQKCGAYNTSFYKSFYQVCPPNYFGYKCRFKCRCKHKDYCRYPDGKCNNDVCYEDTFFTWIPPTCHIKKCVIGAECSNNGKCEKRKVNNMDIFYCKCDSGYEYINDSCTDINECLTNMHTCSLPSQICNNTIGSFNCSCIKGYSLENNECIDTNQRTNNTNMAIIIGTIIGGIVLILLLILIIIVFKRFNIGNNLISKRYLANSNTNEGLTEIDNTIEVNEIANNIDLIHEENLYSKVNKENFETEFQKLPIKALRSCDYGKIKENRPKNRFKNITPYDDNRLKLKVINDDIYSDYINATLISNIDGSQAIATQGPNLQSMNDFWRMVVEYNVYVIVMLCNIRENDKVKCDQYWPSDKKQFYGDFEIELKKERKWLEFIERSFLLNISGQSARKIIQFQFTGWPDHGIPENITSLLTLRKMARNLKKDHIEVIHCSAGVGRTGCFISIDNMIEARMTRNDSPSVFDFVNSLRVLRQQMVQSLEQYKLIYTAISTHLFLGDTIFTFDEFHERFTNGKYESDQHLKNQYNALKNEKGKAKKARYLSNNKITSHFSEIIFHFYSKLTLSAWTDDIHKNSNQLIYIANEQESLTMLPSIDKPIVIDNVMLTLDISSPTDYGYEKIIKKKKVPTANLR